MKKYFLFACVAAALVSCSSDDFFGENQELTQKIEGAILFTAGNQKAQRANLEHGAAAEALGRQFYVYGVKKNSSDKYDLVFNNYSVWYNGASSSSNSEGWEYVSGEGVSATTYQTGMSNAPTRQNVPAGQFIKYWDYSSAEYWFNAVSADNTATPSPKEKINWAISSSTGQIESATISPVSEANTVFYADAVKREKTNYANTLANGQTSTGQPVKFNFKRLQTKVRLGFYETVPGYAINDVKFYPAASSLTASTAVDFGTPSSADAVTLVTNAAANDAATPALSAGFMPASNQTYKITYAYNDNGKASLTNTTTSLPYEKSKTFGKLNYTVERNLDGASGNEKYMGETSTTPTWATANGEATVSGSYQGSAGNNYWLVLPNESQSAAFKIKVDYTLTSLDGSNETIKVTGATAVVPTEYCKWEGNTAYTYLFKISDNTNGTTGDPSTPTDPVGLYPITFDACVVDMMENTQGTTTQISDYAITTYQEGSVVDNGITYKTGKNIDVTILDNEGDAATTGGNNKVWYVYNSNTANTKVTKTPVNTLTNGKFSIASPETGVYAISYKWNDGTKDVITTKYVKVGAAGSITDASAIYDIKNDPNISNGTFTLPAGATFVGAYTENTYTTAATQDTDYSVSGSNYNVSTPETTLYFLYNLNQVQHKVEVTAPAATPSNRR